MNRVGRNLFSNRGYAAPKNESIHCPRKEAPRANELSLPAGCTSEMKGWPQSSQVHTCRFEALKRTLEILGSRQPQKRGDFVITESQNRLTQREKSSDFLRCVSPCPSLAAGSFLEFLRSVSAHQNGMCALGRIAAIPSFRVPSYAPYSFVPPFPHTMIC